MKKKRKEKKNNTYIFCGSTFKVKMSTQKVVIKVYGANT
jgi:hypothetical protein